MAKKNDPYGLIGTRVELAAYTDHWMRGDRYGEIVGTAKKSQYGRVKLDKSGKTVRVHYDALQPI